MDNKGKWFYRICIYLIAIFLLINIVVKVIIWTSSSKEVPATKQLRRYAIAVIKDNRSAERRYTNQVKYNVFNKVDHFLSPAFTLFFVIITVKLVRVDDLFEERR